jgi:hypothetical protein
LRAASAALAVAGILAPGRVGRADPESDAHVLFARARAARLRGDCATALPLFRRTLAIYPKGLGSVRNIAECEETQGHFAAARRAWADLGRALVSRTEARYAGWADDARRALDRLAPKVARLAVDVVAPSPEGGRALNRDARVIVNGEDLAPELLGIAVDRDPGTYVVQLAGGPESRAVSLAPGDSKWVTLQWPTPTPPRVTPALARAGTPAGERAARSPGDDGAIVTGAWAAGGIGAAALTGAAVSFVVRQHAIDEVEAGCPHYQSGPCDPSLRPAVDRGHVATTLGDVLFAVGATGAVVGLTLFAIHREHAAHIGVVAGPGTLAAQGEF